MSVGDFEWLPISAEDIRTETLESLEEKAHLANALCVMAFFLGVEQGINEKLGMRLLVHQLMFGGPTL